VLWTAFHNGVFFTNPNKNCGRQDFCEELEYWGLDDLHMEPCCQHSYYRARWLLPEKEDEVSPLLKITSVNELEVYTINNSNYVPVL
jgi:hypothetical protein